MTAERKPSGIGDFADIELCILDRERSTIGEYVQGCVETSGGPDFYFVRAVNAEGVPVDLCHVGNGPNAERVGRAIVAALRSAAPPRGEPVAWATPNMRSVIDAASKQRMLDDRRFGGEFEIGARTVETYSVPLYASPSAGRDAEDARRLDWLDKQFSDPPAGRTVIYCLPGSLRALVDQEMRNDAAEREGSRG